MRWFAAACFLLACAKSSTTMTLPEAAGPSSSSSAPIASAPVTSASTALFPPGTFAPSVERLVDDWYGKQLGAMHEPSLWAAAQRGEMVYRFTWLRTWGRPIAVRVSPTHLWVTRLSGDGGYDPGRIDVQRDRALGASEWQRLESAIAAASFDTIDREGAMGHDGAQWIIERAKGGAYRLVERWSPKNDAKEAAYVRACDVFLDLAGRDLVTGDVY